MIGLGSDKKDQLAPYITIYNSCNFGLVCYLRRSFPVAAQIPIHKNRVCLRFLLGAQEWGLLKNKELSAGSIFTHPLQSGSMREAIWMWQEKKLIMCVSREKGGEVGQEEGHRGLGSLSQQ